MTKKTKIDTTPNVYFRNTLATEKLVDANGVGFEIRALKHSEFAFVQANSTHETHYLLWMFRLGVVSFIGIQDEAEKNVKLFQESHITPLGSEVKYMGEEQCEMFGLDVITNVVKHIGDLSKLSDLDKTKLGFTLAYKEGKA